MFVHLKMIHGKAGRTDSYSRQAKLSETKD